MCWAANPLTTEKIGSSTSTDSKTHILGQSTGQLISKAIMSASKASFCFPVPILENSRLKLVPFDLETHGGAYIDGFKDEPQLFKYMPSGPCTSVEELGRFLDRQISSRADRCWLAIILKPNVPDGDEVLVGTIGYLNADPANCKIEIGYVSEIPARSVLCA